MNSSFEYQESLNSLHFTEEEKAAIARRAAEAARKQTRPARRPVRRIALIAAAAVLVLAVGTAGATGILRSAAEVFSPLFGGAPAQTEIIDKIGYPVGAATRTTASPSPPTPSWAMRIMPLSSTPSVGTTVPACCRRTSQAKCCWSTATART